MKRHVTWLLGALCLSIVACSGATTQPSSSNGGGQSGGNKGGGSATPAQVMDYVAPCGPSVCSGSPASDANGNTTCASANDGKCGWSPGSPGTGADGTVSFRQCAPSECKGVAPAIACAPGYDQSEPICGSENDGPCVYITSCTAHPTGVACAPGACGDAMPEIGVVCGDGGTGTLICGKTAAGTCTWQPHCP